MIVAATHTVQPQQVKRATAFRRRGFDSSPTEHNSSADGVFDWQTAAYRIVKDLEPSAAKSKS
ncbi:hypothetical protein [Acidisoma sp. S159]|uniref:hypothetical protein n=1 Tax=Acidisoma sp. S159 TaxID=1747225 RepID=UPI00131A9DA2|nr:hypothetical protein [Acidisoma sp. S159]